MEAWDRSSSLLRSQEELPLHTQRQWATQSPPTQPPSALRTWPGREDHDVPAAVLSAVEQNVYLPRSSKREPGLAGQPLTDAVTDLTLLNVGELNQGGKAWWPEHPSEELGTGWKALSDVGGSELRGLRHTL